MSSKLLEHLFDGPHVADGRAAEIGSLGDQTRAGKVSVRVDEPGDQDPAREVVDLGVGPDQSLDFASIPHCDDLIAFEEDRLRQLVARIHGDDRGIDEGLAFRWGGSVNDDRDSERDRSDERQ